MIIATSSPIKFKVGAELIKLYQKTQFSHVLIIKDDLVFQASHGKVNCTHINIFLEENKIVNFYEIEDSAIDFDFVKKQLGKKYSIKQIITIAAKFIFGIKHLYGDNGNSSFICSEYVGKALMLEWVNDQTSPADIDKYLKENYGIS
jgi:hypothetical protein